MKWIDSLRGTIVGLDTAPLIYFMEEHPIWLPKVRPFFEALDEGQFQVVTSIITLTEVLVYPFRRLQPDLAEQYRQILLGARNLTTVPVTAAIAEQAAVLRSQYELRTPDAIQLATTIHAKANSFLTNDKALAGPQTIRIITLESV